MSKFFKIDSGISFLWSGKFTAPGNEWLHMTRPLPEYEVFFVTEGTLYIADEEDDYQVDKNSYLIMAPTQKQYGYKASNCSFYWLHFSTQMTFTDALGDNCIPQQGEIPLIERLIILINQLQDTSRRYQHQHTMDLLASGILLELFNQQQANKKKSGTSSKVKLYESILNYVSWDRYQRINVSEIATYLGYHEKYISSVFKELAGMPLKQYLLQELMGYAKAEILNTSKTIAQIGYGLGYTDPHNFSHCFKSVVGISPKEYRNSYITLAKIRD